MTSRLNDALASLEILPHMARRMLKMVMIVMEEKTHERYRSK